jgi:hypothetical protein
MSGDVTPDPIPGQLDVDDVLADMGAPTPVPVAGNKVAVSPVAPAGVGCPICHRLHVPMELGGLLILACPAMRRNAILCTPTLAAALRAEDFDLMSVLPEPEPTRGLSVAEIVARKLGRR